MKKIILFISLGVILIVYSLFAFYPKEYMLKGLSIDGIEVGGLTKQEAKEKIVEYYHSYTESSFLLAYEGTTYEVFLQDIEFEFLIDQSVETAYLFGHRRNIFNNYKDKIHLLYYKKDIPVKRRFNQLQLDHKLNEIKLKINTRPVNATLSFQNNKFTYTRDQSGLEMNIESTKAAILKCLDKGLISFVIPIEVSKVKPDVTYEELTLVKSKVGTYTTTFNSKDMERSANIKLAAKKLNHILLLPGEQFSVNQRIGPRTKAAGFKTAKVILNNEYVEGIGGGVCQVSSTLFNSAMLADLKIVERHSHSLTSAYVPLGRDATINWNNLDLKILNSNSYPVFIYNKLEDGKLTFDIYGVESSIEIRIISETTKIIPYKETYVNDKRLKKGEKKVTQKGKNGYEVNTYRVKLENGVQISREFIDKSVYKPQKKVITIGDRKEFLSEKVK